MRSVVALLRLVKARFDMHEQENEGIRGIKYLCRSRSFSDRKERLVCAIARVLRANLRDTVRSSPFDTC